MSGLRVEEAAKIVGRSLHTIYRWRRRGVNVADRDALLQYSSLQEMRSRGKTRQAFRRRLDGAGADLADHDCRPYFRSVIDPEQFVELPAPFSEETANRALELLREIEAAFLHRLQKLDAIGHEYSIELAKTDVAQVTEAYRLLTTVFEGFPD
ncbi:MAG: hypothetical protein C5B58_05700 [Acidobacteria bacterium]|nr:MAG: hypothetical protein C5B58_05700 [Acidobacteriota bacterium]